MRFEFSKKGYRLAFRAFRPSREFLRPRGNEMELIAEMAVDHGMELIKITNSAGRITSKPGEVISRLYR